MDESASSLELLSCSTLSLFKIPSMALNRLILNHIALNFSSNVLRSYFVVPAFDCKICLIWPKIISIAAHQEKFKQALSFSIPPFFKNHNTLLMNYWLVKSEPEEYGYADLEAEEVGCWDGVRNYQARNNLRAMKTGDLVFFYHSRQGLEIVGLAKVVNEAYPDPTAEKGDWSAVDLAPVRRLTQAVSLKAIKATTDLQEIALVRNPRLSVMPISADAFAIIMKMAGEAID